MPGNKLYGPETCCFVPARVNSFVTEGNATRGEYPIGVYYDKTNKRIRAVGWSVTTSKRRCLGYFDTSEEAHQAWLAFKLEQAKILAAEQDDPRVAEALVYRYENYTKLKEEGLL